MKNILGVLIGIIAIYFIYFAGSPLKNDFYFNEEIYSHVKKIHGGVITNHYYTPGGVDLNSSYSFIQILECKDDIQKSDWPSKFASIYNQYKLKPVKGQQFNLAGSIQKAGMYFNSYGAPINVEGREHMAFYLIASDEEPVEESNSQKLTIIEKLKNIEFD
jgi:hypothetical protein